MRDDAGNRPSALVIGPMKSGTTWVDRYFRIRGDICVPAHVKETFFFDRNYGRGLGWYVKHFSVDKARHGLIAEVAPSYFHCQEAPDRIHQTLGDVQLVTVLRDPVSRAYSHYMHLLRYGFTTAGLRQSVESYPEIVEASKYASQLKNWINVFGQNKVLVLFQHHLENDPLGFVSKLCIHLGISFIPPATELSERVNEAALPSSPKLAALGQMVADALRVVGMYQVINAAKNLGFKELFFGRPNTKTLPKLSDEDRLWLEQIFTPEVVELEGMLGIDLAMWKHL